MTFAEWFGDHWFDLLQTASILFGLFATVHTIRADTRERKIDNLFALNSAYRDIWSKLFEKPRLYRVLQTDIDLTQNPPNADEELFVQFLILHLRSSFKARKAGMEFDGDAVIADVRQFFSRPIPFAVWEESKMYQDADFVAFVDGCLSSESVE